MAIGVSDSNDFPFHNQTHHEKASQWEGHHSNSSPPRPTTEALQPTERTPGPSTSTSTMMQVIAMTQTSVHAQLMTLMHNVPPRHSAATTADLNKSPPRNGQKRPLAHLSTVKREQALSNAVPSVKYDLQVLQSHHQKLERHALTRNGSLQVWSARTTEVGPDDGEQQDDHAVRLSLSVTTQGFLPPVHAQHGEQLRMRGIQPSQRTNEIHMHIAPTMDTSVKHVIAKGSQWY